MRLKGNKRYQECREVGTGNELAAWGHTVQQTQASLFGGCLTGRVCSFWKLEGVVGARWETAWVQDGFCAQSPFLSPERPQAGSTAHQVSGTWEAGGGRETPPRTSLAGALTQHQLRSRGCLGGSACVGAGILRLRVAESSPGRTRFADRENPQPVGAGERAWPLGASSGLQKGLLERYLTRIQQ